ncbi:MAG: hypothetical protein LBU23_13680 [Planctomycetota bacterium]|nr:hypothetical protein [Planctomycetota bacterium]
MRGRGALILLGILAAWPAGAAEAANDPEIKIHAPAQWAAGASFPVILDARSETGAELRLTLRGWDAAGNIHVITRRAALPPVTPVRLELTSPAQHYTLQYAGGNVSDQRPQHFYNFSEAQLDGAAPAPLACLNSFMMGDFGALDSGQKRPGGFAYAVAADDLPGRWQSYANLTGVLVMEPRAAAALRPDQRGAVARWARWFGGRIWLAGDGAAGAAASLGLEKAAGERSAALDSRLEVYPAGNGWVFLQREADAATLARHAPWAAPSIPDAAPYARARQVNPLAAYFPKRPRPGVKIADPSGAGLFETLGGMPIGIIIGSLLLLGLILGPLNYWFIRRRRNSLLFFITTPLIALAGTAVIVAGTFLSEGLDGEYNQFAVLARDAASGEAMLFDLRAVRPGLFAASPSFSGESLALPLRNDAGELHSDLGGGLGLVSGWLKPRFPSGFLLVQPATSRLNLALEREGGSWYARNGLGFAVKRMAARFPDGSFGLAEDIAPGERKKLRPDEQNGEGEGGLPDLYLRARRLADDQPAFSGVTLAAECAGLPYLQDGGMNSERLGGEYFFLAVGDPGGLEP